MSASLPTIAVASEAPEKEAVALACEELAAGKIVAVPTETFYGLAADPWNPSAVTRLLAAKGRPEGAPILLLMGSIEQARLAAAEVPPAFETLAIRFWPGPLTLVVPARPELSDGITARSGTVGLRVPGLALPRAIATALDRPVTGTSANRSGLPPARDAAGVAAALGDGIGEVSLLLDGGLTRGGPPSTVVDLCGHAPRLVREGAIPYERILDAL